MTKKQTMLSRLILGVFLGIFSSQMAGAAEKLTCDISDAPNVDLTAVIQSLEQRIDALSDAEAALQQARKDLLKAVTQEEAGFALETLASVVKATSAITLTVTGAIAASPEILVISVMNTTLNMVVDAVNNGTKAQDQVLKDTLTGYGASNVDQLMGNLMPNEQVKAAWGAFSVLYTTVVESIKLVSLADSQPALRSQVKGINKQLASTKSKIALLKQTLSKMQSQIKAREKKIDTTFLTTWKQYIKKNPLACSNTKPQISGVKTILGGVISAEVSFKDPDGDANKIRFEYTGAVSGSRAFDIAGIITKEQQKQGATGAWSLISCPVSGGGVINFSAVITDQAGNVSSKFDFQHDCGSGGNTDNGSDEGNQSCANAMAQEGTLLIAVLAKNSACVNDAGKTRDTEKSNCDSQHRDKYGYYTEGHEQCLKDAEYKYYNVRQACDAVLFEESKAIRDNTNRICSRSNSALP